MFSKGSNKNSEKPKIFSHDKDVKSFANIMLSRNNVNELINLQNFNEYYEFEQKTPTNI